jgi:hypothetical protein
VMWGQEAEGRRTMSSNLIDREAHRFLKHSNNKVTTLHTSETREPKAVTQAFVQLSSLLDHTRPPFTATSTQDASTSQIVPLKPNIFLKLTGESLFFWI